MVLLDLFHGREHFRKIEHGGPVTHAGLYLGKDCIADERVKGAFDDKVDVMVEAGFEIIREIDQFPSDGQASSTMISISLSGVALPRAYEPKTPMEVTPYFSRIPVGIPGERPVYPGSMS